MRPIHQIMENPFALVGPLLWLAATLLAGLLVRSLLFRAVRGWAARAGSKLDVLVVGSLRGPIVVWSLILGLHLATQNSEIPKRYLTNIPMTLTALWILSATLAMSRLAGDAVRLYAGRITGAHSVTSLTERLTQLGVLLVGAAWILHVFSVSLTPILTTLGVGGLAVALALQDTLSNLFAGFYVSVSGLVHVGDYIKLNTGEEGYVTDINWRCTTMRGTSNNLVVVPNAKLGQAIYTNYFLPDCRMIVQVSVNVGYDSDVESVQAILLEETTAAASATEGMVADPAPWILFSPGAGDWALGFQVNFGVSEYGRQQVVQSELRKRLYKRLKAEGVSMPFPTHTVQLERKDNA